MRYAILIYDTETANPSPEPPDPAVVGRDHGRVQRLHPDAQGPRRRTSAARRSSPSRPPRPLRVKDGQTVTTDGPFAETKEGLGGFYLIEAPDLDEALDARARSAPASAHGVDRGPAGRRTIRRPRRRGSAVGATRRLSLADAATHERRRPPVPRGAGTGGRDAHPRPRRLRPRRGGGPGRIHRRARDLARTRGPGQPGRVDHDDRPEPGDRPAAPPPAAARQDRGARVATRAIEAELAAIEPGSGAGGRHAASPTIDCA